MVISTSLLLAERAYSGNPGSNTGNYPINQFDQSVVLRTATPLSHMHKSVSANETRLLKHMDISATWLPNGL